MIIVLTCYLRTQAVQIMKLKQMMFMKTFMKTKNLFDLSDYPEESKLSGPVNNKVIGKMKN